MGHPGPDAEALGVEGLVGYGRIMTTVAVLGLGTMGLGMAKNLLAAGYVVHGFNRSSERGVHLEESGGTYFSDPIAAIEGADAAIVCLANDAATGAVVFAPRLLSDSAPGMLLIDSGTTSLELTERIDAACQAHDVEFLDAPITGSKLGAEGGRLTFMVGGPRARLDRAEPLFEAMGRHVVHAGTRIGDGQRIKYCLNMSQAIVLQGVLEGYALASAQGLPVEKLEEVFEKSAGRTAIGAFKTPYLRARDFTAHFRLDLMLKDLHLALRQAQGAGQPVPLGHAITSLYALASRRGWGSEDFLAVAKLLEFDGSDET
ncbi:MAG: NAD(P)-dependent oxidoreductase [Myxococcota bacterium]